MNAQQIQDYNIRFVKHVHKSGGMFNLLTRLAVEDFEDGKTDKDELEKTLIRLANLNEKGFIKYQ